MTENASIISLEYRYSWQILYMHKLVYVFNKLNKFEIG